MSTEKNLMNLRLYHLINKPDELKLALLIRRQALLNKHGVYETVDRWDNVVADYYTAGTVVPRGFPERRLIKPIREGEEPTVEIRALDEDEIDIQL